MSDERFTEGELFVYVNGDRWELGMVKRPNNTGDGYFCWYSTGDTAANTPVDHMHKLANHGFTKVEGLLRAATNVTDATGGRQGVAGTCHVEAFDDGVDEGMDGDWYAYAPPTWFLSCGHQVEGAERPKFCPNCGARVVDLREKSQEDE